MIAQSGADTDEQLVALAVGELASRTRFPVAFGGLEHHGAVHVTSIVGTRTQASTASSWRPARGLGGRALVEKRPRLAADYRSARGITHDYDRAILGEGISTCSRCPSSWRAMLEGFCIAARGRRRRSAAA